jgi:hypothetical protein
VRKEREIGDRERAAKEVAIGERALEVGVDRCEILARGFEQAGGSRALGKPEAAVRGVVGDGVEERVGDALPASARRAWRDRRDTPDARDDGARGRRRSAAS